MPSTPRSRILLAYAAIYLIWGSTYLAIRIGIESMPPFVMAGTRFLGIGLVVFLFARWRGQEGWPSPRAWAEAALLGGLMLAGGNGMVSWAEERVASSVAALLITTVPLWMVILDRFVFRATTLGPTVVAGLACGFLGVVLLVGPAGNDLDRVDPRGAAALVLGSLLWAIGSLRSRRGNVRVKPLLFVSMQMIAAGAILYLMALASGQWEGFRWAQVSGRSWWAIAYLSIFGSLVALSSYLYLLRHQPSSSVGTYAFVNPIVAVILGTLFAGEQLGPRSIAAGVLIVGAVVLIHSARVHAGRRRRRAARAAAQATEPLNAL